MTRMLYLPVHRSKPEIQFRSGEPRSEVICRQQKVRDHDRSQRCYRDRDNDNEASVSLKFTAIDGAVYGAIAPSRQDGERTSQGHHGHSHEKGKARALNLGLWAYLRCQLPKPHAKPCDDKSQADDRDARADPCKERSLVCQVLGGFLVCWNS